LKAIEPEKKEEELVASVEKDGEEKNDLVKTAESEKEANEIEKLENITNEISEPVLCLN
jgi:hypothetical protein